jgi:NADH dehydrogenase
LTAPKRIFIAGGSSILANRLSTILLDYNATVTLMVGSLETPRDHRVTVIEGDAWNPGSLRGRGRGHDVVIDLIGSLRADPRRGLTYKHLNQTSARNIGTMAMNDGVPHLILLSAAAAPFGVPGAYLESKRDAESDIKQLGIGWTIVRTPILFVPGAPRHTLYRLVSLVGFFPLLNLLLAAHRPLSVEKAALGIASLALTPQPLENRLIGARRLRILGERQGRNYRQMRPHTDNLDEAEPESEPDEPPFGWTPPMQ